MAEYLNNKKLEESIHRYRATVSNPEKKKEFSEAQMQLTKDFYLLSEKIYLAYKYMFANNVDWEEALQEGTFICFEKIHRFNPEIGRAFPFFTQIILNHLKQLCRSAINYRNLTLKYHQHLCEKNDNPHIQMLKSKNKYGTVQNFSNEDV
jgi:DNA-directed RNA polymerase specialized sigma24 family protein